MTKSIQNEVPKSIDVEMEEQTNENTAGEDSAYTAILVGEGEDEEGLHQDMIAILKGRITASQKAYRIALMTNDDPVTTNERFIALTNYKTQLKAFLGDETIVSHVSAKEPLSVLIQKNDIIKFQLKSMSILPFVGEQSYDSVEHFLRSFEKVIFASGADINEAWLRYLPLAVSYDHDLWVEAELKAVCKSWKAARQMFEERFSSQEGLITAEKKVFDMYMGLKETVLEYTTTFLNALREANLDKKDSMLARKYRFSMTSEVQRNCNYSWGALKPKGGYSSIEELSNAARDIMGDRSSLYHDMHVGTSQASKRTLGGGTERGIPSIKKTRSNETSSSTTGCRKHGGVNANHSEAECKTWKSKGVANDTRGSYFGNKNSPIVAGRASGSNTVTPKCHFCSGDWNKDHRCQQYRDAMAKKAAATEARNVYALSVQETDRVEAAETRRLEESRVTQEQAAARIEAINVDEELAEEARLQTIRLEQEDKDIDMELEEVESTSYD